jgi:ABC-type uncharacterized transport system ATPase component
MITFIQCIRKKPEMSIQDFRREWKTYQAKATELAKAINATGLSFCTTLAVEENLQVMLTRGTAEPFDGIAEMRISNAPRTIEALGREPARSLMLDFQAMQSSFVDLERSTFFFSAEETVIHR